MAYDPTHRQIVLFGGLSGGHKYGGTWTWDGTDWTFRDRLISPPARRNSALAYDAARSQVLLAAGSDEHGNHLFADTWTWNGTDWSQRSLEWAPSGLFSSMAGDPHTGAVILTATKYETDGPYETWAWDGTQWSSLAVEHSPSQSAVMSTSPLTYDLQRHAFVLYQGSQKSGTWTLNYAGEAPVSLSGRVTRGGEAMGKVTITLSGTQSRSTTTDDSGRYYFLGLASGGNYTVTPDFGGLSFTPTAAAYPALSVDRTADFVAPLAIGTTLTMECSRTTAQLGQQVTLVAKLQPASAGSVSFYDGTTPLGTAWLAAGRAELRTARIPAGTRSLRAIYQGDATHKSSASPAIALRVDAKPAGGLVQASEAVAQLSGGSAVVADFNLDGKADLAFVSGGLYVFLGDGNGGFSPLEANPIVVGDVQRLAVADFNGDGKDDLAMVNVSARSVQVLLGNGSGGFTWASGLALPLQILPDIHPADFNLDGKIDVAIISSDAYGSRKVRLLQGDGNGGFSEFAAGPIALATSVTGLAVADFDNDGAVDLAIRHVDPWSTASYMTVWRGDGKGGGSIGAPIPTSLAAGLGESIAVADFNGDGNPDLALGAGGVAAYLGDGNGGLASAGPIVFAGRSITEMQTADFNGDGLPDLAAGRSDGVTILLGDGRGGFGSARLGPYIDRANSPLSCLAVADFNGDGRTDMVTSYSQLTAWFGSALPAISISGHVLAGGVALAGVAMELSGSQSGSATTGSDGRFEFSGLAAGGTYTVSPHKAGYRFNPESITLTEISSATTADFSATLTVFSISGNAGVAGADVALSGSSTASAIADGGGAFAFSSLVAGGNYTVTPTKTNYTFTPAYRTFNSLAANQTATFTAALNTYTISGNAGVAGATVALSGSATSSTAADSSGAFTFASLAAGGNYTVTPTKT